MAKNDKNLRFIKNKKTGKIVVESTTPPTELEINNKPIPGFYKIKEYASIFGTTFEITAQKEIKLPATAKKTSEMIMDTKEIDRLFSLDSLRIHKKMGIPAKLGFLLHGTQGTGKTTAMYSVAATLVEQYNATVLEVSTASTLAVAFNHIKMLRKLEPTTLAVVLMDECEEEMHHRENTMKLLLDSKDTPTNFIFIGATNYYNKIPATIANRPSRIKFKFDCSFLNKEEDIVYTILKDMNSVLDLGDQLSEEALKEATKVAVGMTIDEIKHIFIGAAVTKAETTPKPKTKTKKEALVAEELK